MALTIQQRVKIAAWFECMQSVIEVQRRFHMEYGEKPPTKDTIHKWHRTLLETGSVCDAQRSRICSSEATLSVWEHFKEHPTSSQRQASRALNVSRSFIQKQLHDFAFHPYKMEIVHELSEEDHAQRVSFALDELHRIESDVSHLSFLAFSDESHFSLDGSVNRHNCRYWAPERPKWIREHGLHPLKTTVWAAMWSGGVIGPYFFDETVTGDRYLAMLDSFLWPKVTELHLSTRLMFMQDGAPPHWKKEVRQWLEQHFPQRWMGRASPNMPWPPRSPDMTPCDFFLWGFIKSRVYRTQPTNMADLKAKIAAAFKEVTPDMLEKSLLSYKERLHRCVERDGRHVEGHSD